MKDAIRPVIPEEAIFIGREVYGRSLVFGNVMQFILLNLAILLTRDGYLGQSKHERKHLADAGESYLP